MKDLQKKRRKKKRENNLLKIKKKKKQVIYQGKVEEQLAKEKVSHTFVMKEAMEKEKKKKKDM